MGNEIYHHGIKGQKWGVRRYQNDDGTLTPSGKKRYERDKLENLAKKKDNRIDVSKPDPNRWVKEDLTRKQNIIQETSKLVKTASNIEQKIPSKASTKKMDLSKMSDKEMRQLINRELLEQQYRNLFSEIPKKEISKGRRYTKNIIDASGTVLTLTGSALTLAKLLKELRG